MSAKGLDATAEATAHAAHHCDGSRRLATVAQHIAGNISLQVQGIDAARASARNRDKGKGRSIIRQGRSTMSMTREELDAKLSAFDARIEGRFINIERDVKRLFALGVASIGTTMGTGFAAYQGMLSHFDTVLEAYHSGARHAQDIRVVTLPVQVHAPAAPPE